MVEILIQGGDTEAAATELAAAVREIFEVEPTRSTTGGGQAMGTRGLVEAALITLAVPSAVHHTHDILARTQLGARLRRLIGKAEAVHKTTGCRILVDPGDGKHIPLEEAHREHILEALHHVEQRLKA
jgi:hypothetical protein